MDADALRSTLIPLHGAIGAVALLAGAAALGLRKGRGWHPVAGRVFLFAMFVGIAVAVPVIALRHNIFLAGMGSVTAYFSVMGWRVAQLRVPTRMPTTVDRLLPRLGMAIFGLFALFGVLVLVRGNLMGLAPVILGSLAFRAALRHHRFFGSAVHGPRDWVAHHARAVGIAFIASVTAFNAAAVPRWLPDAPHWFLWLWPTVVIAPFIMRMERTVRRRDIA